MELNREQIGNILGVIFDKVGAFGMYAISPSQAVMILRIIKELTEENERLKADKDYWKNRAKESESEYNQAVKRGYNLGAIDYVGSFAERLKAKAKNNEWNGTICGEDIDQIAKEMLEGGDQE